MRAFSFALIVLSLAAVSGAQGVAPSPAEVLRGEAKSFSIKDVPDDYRALILGSDSALTPWMLFGAMGGGGQKPSERLLFRSLGAVWVQPDEFGELLEGKRPRIRALGLDLASMMGSGSHPTPMFVESWLEAGRIVTWSPAPELNKDALAKAFAAEAGPDDATAAAAATAEAYDRDHPPTPVGADGRTVALKQIALGAILYAADNNDRFPKAQASSQLKPIVTPYLKSMSVFNTVESGGRVLYNTYLSGVRSTSIPVPSQTPLLWEETAWPDGRRAVAFADGHVKRLTDALWKTTWKFETDRRAGRGPKQATLKKGR